MKNLYFSLLILLISQTYINAQSSLNPIRPDTLNVTYSEQEMLINSKKIDSLLKTVVHELKTKVNPELVQKSLNVNIDKMEKLLKSFVDIMVDSSEEKKKLQSEIQQSIHNAKPLIDSALNEFKKALNTPYSTQKAK